MAKKILIPEEEVVKIIKLYVEDKIGTPTLSKMFNYHKSIINRALKDNGVDLDSPGRRYLGGKKISDAKYYKNNKNKIVEKNKKWSQKNREYLKNYHSKWRELNRKDVNEKSKSWSKNNRIIAHQFKIRQQKEIDEKDKINFDYESLNLKNSIVKEITRKECEKIINEYEWLGYLPKYTKHHFGLFFNVDGVEHLGGVVAIQPEYGNNVGVWDKYGYTDKIIQLSRGVCLWWTPKNSASYMISKVLKWLTKNTNYEVVSATVDSNAGEIGTIYQSLGWHYTGTMEGNLTKNGKERIRYGYKIKGKIYNQRHIRKMIGTASRDEVLKKFPDVEIVNMGRKKRYFKFIKNEKNHLEKIKHLLKPYPKRK